MTLRIYRKCIQLSRDVHSLIKQIAKRDRNLADQLRRAVTSIVLNLAESDGQYGGHRRERRMTALGSARETHACLELAEALDYIEPLDADTIDHLDHIIAVLVVVTR